MKKKFFAIIILIFTSVTACAEGAYTFDSDCGISIDYYGNNYATGASLLSEGSMESTFHNAVRNHEIITIYINDVATPAIHIDLSAYNLDVSTDEKRTVIEQMIQNIGYQCLEYFYISNTLYTFPVEGDVITDVLFVVRPEFTGDNENTWQTTLDSYINQYNLRCTKILAETLYPEMTPAETALALHSYLGEKLYYDNDFDLLSFTSYNAIMGEKAVCQGYSFAYKHLLRLMGIDSVIATSKDMNHAWNVVNIDGNWYHADPTRDDIEGYGVMHRYFLVSDETLEARGHHNWTAPVNCVSKDYETGYFFNPEYTDKLYSSDFMTCRRNDEGYFLYIRDKKYYKSTFNGAPTEITADEYNRDRSFEAKLSYPFVYTDESFDFISCNTDNATIALINQSDSSITGRLMMAYYNSQGIADTKLGNELTLNRDEYLLCKLNTASGCDYIKAFFWNNSLMPYSSAVVAE